MDVLVKFNPTTYGVISIREQIPGTSSGSPLNINLYARTISLREESNYLGSFWVGNNSSGDTVFYSQE
jgi:hypothetical protein